MPSKRKAYGAVVHNSAAQKAKEYEIRWSAAAPPGCARVQKAKPFQFSLTVKADLEPDETKAEEASEVSISDLREVAEKLGTDFLQVQVGVVRVKFDHGASWHEDPANQESGVFMPSVLEADRDKCGDK